MMGTMVECAHFGPASCWLVSPVVGNPPKILSAGGGWGRINPPPVADPTSLTSPHWASSSATPPISRPIYQFSFLTC